MQARATAHEEAAGNRSPAASSAEAERAAGRLAAAATGALDLLAVALGDRLGYYRLLAERQPLTARGLAASSGTAPRYAREWLEQQAVTGLLDVLDPGLGLEERSYRLRPGAAEALADPDQLTYLAPLARQVAAAARQFPALVDAFRSGGGVPWASYGAAHRRRRPRPRKGTARHRNLRLESGYERILRRIRRPRSRLTRHRKPPTVM